jgi:hypothetical protein
VVSGLLLEDVPAVRQAFAACGAPRERTLGEWAALVFDAPGGSFSAGAGAPR